MYLYMLKNFDIYSAILLIAYIISHNFFQKKFGERRKGVSFLVESNFSHDMVF